MKKPTNLSFSYDPCSDTQELSSKEVSSAIQKYWSTLLPLQKLLVDTQKIFTSTRTIWPDQCDWTIDKLHFLTERVQLFSDFLDTSSQFSGSFRLLRYPLTQKLHYLDAQLRELCIQLIAFRTHCQASTYVTICQMQEISSCLKKLLQHWRQLVREVQFVLEQIEISLEEKGKRAVINIENFKRSK